MTKQEVDKLVETILEKCSECEKAFSVKAIMQMFMETLDIIERSSPAFRRLKECEYTTDDFFGVITSTITSFLSTVLVNTLETDEERKKLMEELKPDMVLKGSNKADA